MAEDTAATPQSSPGWRRLLLQGLAFLVLVAFLGLLAYGLRMRGHPGPQVGQPAPPFTLTLYGGGEASLEELRGKVVVVNFWASWCQPCRVEAPVLEGAWRRYRDQGVVFLGVDYVDTEPKALEYLREFDITYPNGPDLGSKISHLYRIQGVPETFFIDRDGKIAPIRLGDLELAKFASPIDEGLLRDTIERLLAE